MQGLNLFRFTQPWTSKVEKCRCQCAITLVTDSSMEHVRMGANSSFFGLILHNTHHPVPQVEIAFVTASGKVVCTSGCQTPRVFKGAPLPLRLRFARGNHNQWHRPAGPLSVTRR